MPEAAVDDVGEAVPREERVVAGASVDPVAAVVTLQLVVAGPAEEDIVPVAAVQQVGAGAALEHVVAVVAVEHVVAAEPADHVVAGRAEEQVGPGRADDRARAGGRGRVSAADEEERDGQEHHGCGLDAGLLRIHGSGTSETSGVPHRRLWAVRSAETPRAAIPRQGIAARWFSAPRPAGL